MRKVSGTLGLPVFEENGVRSSPVFTGVAEFARWGGEGAEYVALDAVRVLEAFLETPADRIVVDPSSERAFAIDRDEARVLVDAAGAVSEKASKVMIQPPPPVLTPLLFLLREACARYTEIREAYLYRSHELSDDAPIDDVPEDAWTLTLLFAFEAVTTQKRREEIFRGVGEAWRTAAAQRFEVIQTRIAVRVLQGDNEWLRALSRTAAPVKP